MASGDPELQDIRVSSGNLFPFLHPWNGYRRWTTQKVSVIIKLSSVPVPGRDTRSSGDWEFAGKSSWLRSLLQSQASAPELAWNMKLYSYMAPPKASRLSSQDLPPEEPLQYHTGFTQAI